MHVKGDGRPRDSPRSGRAGRGHEPAASIKAIRFNRPGIAIGEKVPNPAGTSGSALAGAAPFQGDVRACYGLEFGGCAAFAQVGAVHQSRSLSSAVVQRLDLQGHSEPDDLPGFTTDNDAMGVGGEPSLMSVYGENLTEARGQLHANVAQWYEAVTVNRPRTLGLRLSCRFAGS